MRLKVFGLAIYFQTSSLRGTARVLSEFRSISKTAVWRRVVKLRERLSMSAERKVRHFIAVDETRVNVNGEQCWVYSALAHKHQAHGRRSLTQSAFSSFKQRTRILEWDHI